MTDDIARELERHTTQIAGLKEDVHAIRGDMGDVRSSLIEIRTTLAEHKGGVRAVLWLSSAAATVGGAIGAVMAKVTGHGGP
jgi:hypothetical protein